MSNRKLPPLPEPVSETCHNCGECYDVFSSFQMEAYAREAIRCAELMPELISELIKTGKELHEAQAYYDKVDAPGSHRWDRLCAARANHAVALAKVTP